MKYATKSTNYDKVTIERLQTLLSKVKNVGSCWEWTGAISSGYGAVWNLENSQVGIHRLIKEITSGKAAKGLVIDHLCKNKLCCNPKHLEMVTQKVNFNRGLGGHPQGIFYKSHCKEGHFLEIENIYIKPSNGYLECRTCRKLRRTVGVI